MAELRTFSRQDCSTELALGNNMRAARPSLIAVSCTPDVWRLCSGQIPDMDRIIACLRQNTLQLSDGRPRGIHIQQSGSAAATATARAARTNCAANTWWFSDSSGPFWRVRLWPAKSRPKNVTPPIQMASIAVSNAEPTSASRLKDTRMKTRFKSRPIQPHANKGHPEQASHDSSGVA
jgi:hypothetical protein